MNTQAIAVDVMGGDRAPDEVIKGIVETVRTHPVDLILVGRADLIKRELSRHRDVLKRVAIHHAPDLVEMDEKPLEVLKKKESSLYVCAKLVAEGKAGGFVSAGNTGALLAAATFVVGRIPGLERPALATPLPAENGVVILIDAGANAEVRPRNMLDFARMGIAYAKILGISKPRVGILNIGEEEEKGNSLVKESYELLKKELGETFVGNVQARDIPFRMADVVVADGFSGNVVLKSYEGAIKFFVETLKKEMRKKPFPSYIGAFMMKPVFNALSRRFDYREHGGAFMLGVKGVVVKAHGSSDALAIYNALKVAQKGVQMHLPQMIEEMIS